MAKHVRRLLGLAPLFVGKSGHLRLEIQEEVNKSNRVEHPALFIPSVGRFHPRSPGLLLLASEERRPQLR